MKRRSTAYRIVKAFILVLVVILLPITVWAQETTLITVVPTNHTLHIEVTGDGTITIDGVAYTQTADVQVWRQHRPEITIQAADGSIIKTLLWGNKDVTAAFQDGKWTAPEVLEDAVLTVTFEKISNTPQTGDNIYLEFWIALLIFSMLGFTVCLLGYKKKYA